jgi:phosphatidylethanolamine/phosphatidyl-N-methylethanolamine N-methyltransferase
MSNGLPLFFRQLLRGPQAISAVAPSSPALARAMAAPLVPGMKVAEFGPGTGALTAGILARVPAQDVTLFEMNAEFAAHLAATLPEVTVHNAPAQEIGRLGGRDFDAVVSGLPLLSMPESLREDIYAAAFDALKPGGFVVQFTYGPRPPLPADLCKRLGLIAATGPRIWLNLPPARVYIYSRRADGMRRYAN